MKMANFSLDKHFKNANVQNILNTNRLVFNFR
jgi:hypothetical protein